jgi:hypothetical protein
MSHISQSIWLKDILPRTPGIVRSVAKREFTLACREFYRRSAVWRDTIDNVFWVPETYAYSAESPDSAAEISQILAVEVNGLPLNAVVSRPAAIRSTGTPLVWYPSSHDPHDFEIWPTADQYDDTVVVRAALIPLVGSTSLPHMASVRHYDALLDGVLGRLYAHPAKAYSNPTLAEYHLKRFNAAISAAAAEAKQGSFVGQNWTYPRFAK